MNRIELGAYLRQQRDKQDLTLKQAAPLAGVSFPYLSDIEKGGLEKPSYDKLVGIAKAYTVELELLLEVFYGKEEVDQELEEKVKTIFNDAAFNSGTRKKAAAEKMGNYTKKLLVELYEKCAARKTK